MHQQLQSFTQNCIWNYAKYDPLDDFYSLDIHDLPDFIQHEFAAIIMTDDNAWASEATGPENKHWETKMLPALTRYLKNTSDRDEAIEFNSIWRDCVADYMSNRMQELIDDLIPEVFN